jgi:putative ABC transport system permease protein
MAYLPLANILHYRLRSALSALGIGIGVCMLITLSGLARGSLEEIADRWESVRADLIVMPRGWGEGAVDKSGSALPDKYAQLILGRHGDLVERATPVFTWPIKLAGQDQLAVGIDAADFDVFSGGRTPAGRLFDPHGRFSLYLEHALLTPATGPGGDDMTMDISPEQLARHGGLELVIDRRLAKAGGYSLGQTVHTANHDWTIVGIVPEGVMSRVFLPRRTAQFLFGSGDITRGTLLFVKLRPGVDVGPAARVLGDDLRQDVVPLTRYRGMLREKFGIMYLYVDAVNVVALVIAFLFIMVTLYMMVLQRTREIAILKSSGASAMFLVRQVAAESVLLTSAGLAVGVGLSFAAAWAIHAARPLLTVRITPHWVALAGVVAMAGALAAAIFPAWRAMRVDMAEALSYE